MRWLFENLPASLRDEEATLKRCFEAFSRARPVHRILLFGSHARGAPDAHSDVDLCIVADGVARQLAAARDFRRAIRHIRPKPPFTLLPISPQRPAEKRACGDRFFSTVLREGVCLAEED